MSSHRKATIALVRLSKNYTLASALIAGIARIAISTNLATLISISISSFPLRAQTAQTFLSSAFLYDIHYNYIIKDYQC